MATQLPIEVLEQIVEATLPAKLPIACTANDTVTQTLISLTLTCRALWSISCRLLYQHCLDIDSPRRLQYLLRSLNTQRVQDAIAKRPSHPVGLWLAPYAGETIDVPDIAENIEALFTILAKRLDRLVIDIPLRSLYPDEDAGLRRPILRSAFSQLSELREFTSIRDELYLNTTDPPDSLDEEEVWTVWPKLERLALYNVDASGPQFLRALPKATKLQQLVLTRADGIEWEAADQNFPVPKSLRELKVCEVGLASPLYSNSLRSRLYGYIRVPYLYHIDIPSPDTWDFEDPITLAQDFIAFHARAGTLWQLKSSNGVRYTANMRRPRPVGFCSEDEARPSSVSCVE